MNKLDVEIFQRGAKGFALAAVIGDCRIYRGNDKVDVVGHVGEPDVAEVEKVVAQIKHLGGHVAWQGPKRRLKKPKPRHKKEG